MANSKNRQIDTKLWQKRWFQELSHEAKFLYLYLLTNPHCNLSGVYEIMDRLIQFDTGLGNVKPVFDELKNQGEVYRVDDFIVITRYPDNHSWRTSWPIGKCYISELEELPESLIELIRASGYINHYPPISSDEAFVDEINRLEGMKHKGKTQKAVGEPSDQEGEIYDNRKKPKKFDDKVPF